MFKEMFPQSHFSNNRTLYSWCSIPGACCYFTKSNLLKEISATLEYAVDLSHVMLLKTQKLRL